MPATLWGEKILMTILTSVCNISNEDDNIHKIKTS